MARRNPPAKWVLPTIIDPPDRICFQVEVPNERFHIAAFRGALFMLSSAIYWQDDTAHTAKEVALVWREIWEKIIPGCDCPVQAPVGEIGDDMLTRQNSDNPCLIEQSADGIHWCPFIDLSLCLPGSLQGQLQPPPDANQPPPGGCTQFDVTLSARDIYTSNIGVGAGDVVTVTNATGGWWDGGLDVWQCPNSDEYALTACLGPRRGTVGGDPAAAAPHGTLVATDGTNWYDVLGGPITITGVPDGSFLRFQMNDSDLTNNQGSVSFHVEICKNASPATFYYILTDNTYAESGHPVCADLEYHALALNTPTTFTSPVPGDSVNPSNPQSLAFITFSSAQAPTTCLWTNTGSIGYKVTAINVIGATWGDSSGPYHWLSFNSGCAGAYTNHDSNVLPSVPENLLFFEVRSLTQFTVQITIEPCS